MKTINNFINEKLKISSKSKTYNYFPKDKFELREILKKRLAEDKNADLNDIDVSKITDMGYKGFINNKGLFEDLDPHHIDISEWDVYNVKDMRSMFYRCKNFNAVLSKWDVSNVTNMSIMFADCKNFTGKGLENWNVSKVTDMHTMFATCINFNNDLSNWDVSKVTNMNSMFMYCSNFKGEGLKKWNVSNVTDMRYMFCECEHFNCDLNDWDVSKIRDMSYMFFNCKNFNYDLNDWDVSKIGNSSMIGMFEYCNSLKNKPSWYKR